MSTVSKGSFLIPEWKQTLKMYSFWVYVAIGVSPQLFDLAVSYGLMTSDQVPDVFAKAINIMAFLGVASRIIKQAGIAKQQADAEAQAPAE